MQNHGPLSDPASAAVLVRGKALLARIRRPSHEVVVPWRESDPVTQLLAHAVCDRDRADWRSARHHVEAAVTRLCDADPAAVTLPDLLPDIPEWAIAAALHRLLLALPSPSLPLRTWLASGQTSLDHWATTVQWPAMHGHQLSQGTKTYVNRDGTRFDGFLEWPVGAFLDHALGTFAVTVGTIHSAKGKTYDAVLLAVASHGACTPKALAEAVPGSEELRTAYVAMTRPRHLLVVAVPEGTENRYLERFGRFAPSR